MMHHRTGGNATTSLAIEETKGMTATALVSIVDDDESVRESLPDLLRELGFEAQAFASAEEFLASRALSVTGCLVLDVAMPGMSGIALQRELRNRESAIPIVFITAYSAEATQLSLSLTKPFSDQALLDAVNLALERR